MAKKKKKRKLKKPNPMKADLRTPKFKKRVVPSKLHKDIPPDIKEWE
jgi:hypothetical protein